MGTSTDAYLSFGVKLDEDVEIPWHEEDDDENSKFDGDPEAWWRHVKGFKPPIPVSEIWDDNGERVGSKKEHDRKWNANNAAETKWMKKNPLPFKDVNYCHIDSPMIILAVPSTERWAYRGEPTEFSPSKLVVSPNEAMVLENFVKEYFPDVKKPKMRWWLSSYWG